MIQRRRGVLLVEMLTVIVMLGVGGTLMAVAVGAIMRSQKRVVESGNQYARINDFLRCVSRDVRRSTAAALSEGDGQDLRQVLVIGQPPRQVSYRIFKQHVERTGSAEDSAAAKSWNPMTVAFCTIDSPVAAHGAAVSVTAFWPRTGTKDPDPDRRFDLVVRCAGELDHEDK